MTQPFLKAYSELLIHTCHRRGAHAMGGMAAQIPIAGDDAANARALERVRADKVREVGAGHDGTWVAHPALIPLAREVFDTWMLGAHQQFVLRNDVRAGIRAAAPRCAAQALARHHHAAPASRTTSRSACATSPPGSTATAACRSTG